jgi:hypothetical protein
MQPRVKGDETQTILTQWLSGSWRPTAPRALRSRLSMPPNETFPLQGRAGRNAAPAVNQAQGIAHGR